MEKNITSDRFERIKAVLSEKKYLAIAFAAGAIYWGIYFAQVSYTAGGFFSFIHGFQQSYVFAAVPLSILIAALIGITFALLAAKIREIKTMKAGSASSIGGILTGVLASGCPGCAVGLFPLAASFFGISATLASLPFGGIELQLLSVSLLTVSIFSLSKESMVCKV